MEVIYNFIFTCFELDFFPQLLGSSLAVIGKVVMDIKKDGWPIDIQYMFLFIVIVLNWYIIIPGTEWLVWDVIDFSTWGNRFYEFRHSGAGDNYIVAFFFYYASNCILFECNQN